MAQIHLDLGQFAEGADALQSLLAREPNPETARRARYLLGVVLSRLGRNIAAIGSFRAYIEDGGPAVPLARIQVAALLAGEGQHGRAAVELEGALTGDLPPSLRMAVLLSLGRAYAAIGDIDNALTAFQRGGGGGEIGSR